MKTVRQILESNFTTAIDSELDNAEAELNTLIKAEKIKFAREWEAGYLDSRFSDEEYVSYCKGWNDVNKKIQENIRKFEEEKC